MSTTQNKLFLYKPKSKLAYAEQMSTELLAEVSDSEIAKYETEYESNVNTNRKSDIELAQQEITAVKSGLHFLFGENSREEKYIDKALSKGNTLVDTYYGQITNPREVKDMVKQARTKTVIHSTSKGLDETDMDTLNDSIQWLTSKGYVFGRDFTTHNAIDMAQASYSESLMSMSNDLLFDEKAKHNKMLEDFKVCKECNTQPNTFNHESMTVSCECYADQPVKVAFTNGIPCLEYDNVIHKTHN